jgi:hypothetical protein
MLLLFILTIVAEERSLKSKNVQSLERKTELHTSRIVFALLTQKCAVLKSDIVGRQFGTHERKDPYIHRATGTWVPIKETEQFAAVTV